MRQTTSHTKKLVRLPVSHMYNHQIIQGFVCECVRSAPAINEDSEPKDISSTLLGRGSMCSLPWFQTGIPPHYEAIVVRTKLLASGL